MIPRILLFSSPKDHLDQRQTIRRLMVSSTRTMSVDDELHQTTAERLPKTPFQIFQDDNSDLQGFGELAKNVQA